MYGLRWGTGDRLGPLKEAGLGKGKPCTCRKSDSHKVALARSALTNNNELEMDSRHLEMGSWTHVSNLLR